MPRTKTPFADAVVFVVGGGNYIEHQNLQVTICTKSRWKVLHVKHLIQDYVKSRNAAYGNSSAAIGSQKRVSDFVNCFSEEKIQIKGIQVVCGINRN